MSTSDSESTNKIEDLSWSDRVTAAYDAILSMSTELLDDYIEVTGYELLLSGKRKNYQESIGTAAVFPFTGEVELIDVQFVNSTADEWAYGDNSLFHQGYEGEGFIIVKIHGDCYKRRGTQDSYGTLNFRQIEDSHDRELYGLVKAEKTTKTVEVWS